MVVSVRDLLWRLGVAAVGAGVLLGSVAVPAAQAAPTVGVSNTSVIVDCYTTDNVLRPALTRSGVGYPSVLVNATFTGLTPGTQYALIEQYSWIDPVSYPPVAADSNGTIVFNQTSVPGNEKFTWVTGQSYGIGVSSNPYIDDPPITPGFTVTLAVNPDCGSLIYGSPQNVVVSPSKQYALIQQGDGNLVEYDNGRAIWSTQTNGRSIAKTIMQMDGNLVQYGTNGRPTWFSGTAGHAGASLSVQDDGNLVVYANGTALWSSRYGRT